MRRKQDNKTSQAIVDAAERQFARNGFHATSVRDIFKEAGINPGLMTYYFSSKDALFHCVISRRIPFVKEEFHAHFPKAAPGGEALSAYDYFRFYLWFFLRHLPRVEGDFHDYWGLITKSSISYDNAIVSSSLAELDFIAENMAAALASLKPEAGDRQIRGVLLFAEAAVTTINATQGLIEHRLGDGADIDRYIEDTARFMARGF